MNRRTVIVLLICSATLAQNAERSERDVIREILASLKPTHVFTVVMKELRAQTKVPLRFPSLYFDGGKGFFVNVEKSDADGYSVQVATEKGCEGQNYCHDGTVIGSKDPIEIEDGVAAKPVAVSLHNGIKGRFYDGICYSYCNESSIQWDESGYHY